MGAAAIRQADLYLHRGLEAAPPAAFSNTWFQRMAARVSIRGVMHREGESTREVVPWLWFGTALDPDNKDYALLSIYWLKAAGRDDLAMGVLRNALIREPRSPELHLERARLLLRGGRIPEAARALDAGLICTAGTPTSNTNTVKKTLCTYRSIIFEYEGDTNAAIACLSSEDEHSPDVIARVADLRSNRQPAVSAAALLSNLVHVAHRCEDHYGGHDDDEHTEEPLGGKP